MADLVTTFKHDNFFANFIVKNMVNDPFGVEMGKLDWESFKCVTFGHIVLDAGLKLVICKRLSLTNSFKLIIAQSSLEQVGKLRIPIS